jgi:hypothetical protein
VGLGLSLNKDPKGQRGLSDLFFFAKDICGLEDMTEETHGPICKSIYDAFARGKRAGVVVPRDCFKSSLGRATILWLFTREVVLRDNYEWCTLLDSSILSLSNKSLRWIATQLSRNAEYRRLYGDFSNVRKGARISDREIFVSGRRAGVRTEPNFMSSAIKAEVTGLHFDVIWPDDVIGERNYHTQHLRQKAWEHYDNCQTLLVPGGKMLFTSTRWHDADVTGRLMKRDSEQKDQQWVWFVRASYNDINGKPDEENGEPFFPARYPREALEVIKANRTVFAWYSQYMNDPVLKEFSIPFDVGKLYISRAEFPAKLRAKCVTVDPAFRDESMDGGDYASMVVGGFDQYMNWWGIDVQLGHWTASQFVDKLFEIHRLWTPNVFKIERKFTSFLDYAIKLRSRQNGIVLPILWLDRDNRSKETRFACIEPMFRNHHVYFASEIPEAVKMEMENELTRCGFSAHDDFLDALADQFALVNPVMGDEGATETFPMSGAVKTSLPEQIVDDAMKFTMYGSADDGMDN